MTKTELMEIVENLSEINKQRLLAFAKGLMKNQSQEDYSCLRKTSEE